MNQSKETEIVRITPDTKRRQKDQIVYEIPLTIILNGKELITLQCTPEKLEYLAVGFLLSEGLIKKETKIERIDLNEKGWYIKIDLQGVFSIDQGLFSKGSSGGISLQRAGNVRNCVPLDSKVQFAKERVFSMMREFLRKSSLYEDTHGVHSCSLCSWDKMEIFSDDIGRHNAVDKVLGEAFLRAVPTENKAILTTGRVSSEILIKIAKQKVPIIISGGVPTSTAVALAEMLNITIVGSVRSSRINVYTHDYRII